MMLNSIKKILILLTLCLVVFVELPLFSESRSLVLGGKDGWPTMYEMHHITTGIGRFGYTGLELETNSPDVNQDTDLLLHFESRGMEDSAGKYKIVKNNFVRTQDAAQGKYAALNRGNATGMILHGGEHSMFGTSGYVGSFSIEFWLAPSIAGNGETVLSWRSSRGVQGYPIYQTITVLFNNNKLEWTFSNIFEGYTAHNGDVSFTSNSNIIPDKWALHKMTFDSKTGLLEYRINGRIEALQYLTVTGHERGVVYQPILGVPADIELCSSFTGRLDDFRIIRKMGPLPSPADTGAQLHTNLYDLSGGRFVTQPLMTKAGSVLDKIEAITYIPEQTDVRLFVRAGDNYFGWTDNEPEWIPVTSGEKIKNVSGLYFQVAVELYPDGAGKTTPSITSLELQYTERPAPLPPFTVKAEPGDCSVTISWGQSVDDTAGGYYLYYGERPGEYLGRIAVQGPSPINVGNVNSVTLTGLQSGTIYYFAISSWSRYDDHITGNLSQEVYARPYGKKK